MYLFATRNPTDYYSHFAAIIADMIALTLILGVVIGFILHKYFILSKEEYEKLIE